MVLKVYDHVARSAIECTETVGLDHYTIVSVNNSASADWGEYTMASACGRKDGDPLLTPTEPQSEPISPELQRFCTP